MIEGCVNTATKTCTEILDGGSRGVSISHCECVLNAYGKNLEIISAAIKSIIIVYALFHIWMLIDCIIRKSNFNKTLWTILLIFIPLSAIFYYFLVKRRLDRI